MTQQDPAGHPSTTLPLAGLTMVAFASNSILCRLALQPGLIDAASFTVVRVLCGAVMLAAVTSLRGNTAWHKPHWLRALALVAYAAPFSYAYVRIPVGMGALILFPSVQLTMIGYDLAKGQALRGLEWAGLLLALGGLIALTLPGATAPDPIGAGLMAVAGVSWGIYSISGRGSDHPLANTTGNFVYGLPLVLPLLALPDSPLHAAPSGLLYAALSGAIASGLGYALWYTVLPHMSSTHAGILQLLVPIIATVAGIIFLDEPLTSRIFFSSCIIITGVALATVVPNLRATRSSSQQQGRLS